MPSIVQGVSFRSTAGYVTDPAGTTSQTGTTVNYPTTSPQGYSIGYVTIGTTPNKENDSTGVDARLAGCHWMGSNGTNIFGIDMDSSGDADIELAIGEVGYTMTQRVDIYDDTTLAFAVCNGSTGGSSRFFDATGVIRTTAALWASSQVAKRVTFTTTKVRIRIQRTTGEAAINHIKVTGVASGSASINVKVGGAWKVATCHVKVGGVWKVVNTVHVKVGGVWKAI